ncbi:MAG: hypothetical protein AAF202_14305, partial [Pseudomonadota bacterium]
MIESQKMNAQYGRLGHTFRMNFRVLLNLVATFALMFSASFAWAQVEELSRDELSLQQRAAGRIYPGGPDEEKLKVLDGV